ncbi:multifunctional CCA addition/repair protein [Janthinobacterium sp. B9-8]|uniref:multifunctional CCA addition/repair protein n=1 Tax=Janthinobacterium sp. B9-8 TaxID=1236179 RepID=UPI00061D2475|nr:multifunctional CCA addition/repair protein [Janthinobacterium sp. B9-8]AMC35985.1 multifunctional CCA tRNA nucleotidyl transferase/2'3'-cyclic phosphodiesterase/2'nucleotidase/phosphatase [Janthinobacterium sp. B9-8]
MKVYRVGGAVRDKLLGLPVRDIDWVVVGSTAEAMQALGYTPVGKDFPVFLHPKTHQEYALARTERKSGHGYKGFTVFASEEVSLEEDLLRRDLTINAIAEDDAGQITDPFNGQADLRAKLLRHVSPAFSEDPVRILRLARFAARFGFDVAPETLALMQEMVNSGEVDHLVAERVWQELAKGLMEDTPSLMFEMLRRCGALARIAPEIDALWGVPQRADYHPEIDTGVHVMMVLDYTASQNWPLVTRFAALCHDLGKAITPTDILPRHIGHEARGVALVEALCERLRVPSDCRDLARMVCREHTHVHTAEQLRPATVLEVFQRCDAFRKPERFKQMLDACLADARGRTTFENCEYPQAAYLLQLLAAANTVNSGEIAQSCEDKTQIPERIRQARIAAIRDTSAGKPKL